MGTTEIKIGGFGGQGVILAGHIIGKAAAIFGGQHSAMTQSFGPEARGSACSSQVIISDKPVRYPYVRKPQILVVMSQEAFDKFSPQLADNGMLLIEKELVQVSKLKPGIKVFGVPATRLAEELGKKIVLNIVMVGFWTAVTGLVSKEAAAKAVESTVPRGTEELNLKAFNKGYDYGAAIVKGGVPAETAA
ncbi:MAG: 2-oxoacid:acceptor oxidoreductase family protein [Elusimicrobia bacterium]|nr:2-oxoacid:acceptor oxidoreductase family protein [Elusimicrobiota bacterium]